MPLFSPPFHTCLDTVSLTSGKTFTLIVADEIMIGAAAFLTFGLAAASTEGVLLAGISAFSGLIIGGAATSAYSKIVHLLGFRTAPLASVTAYGSALASIIAACGNPAVTFGGRARPPSGVRRFFSERVPRAGSFYNPATDEIVFDVQQKPELGELLLWHEIGHRVLVSRGIWPNPKSRRLAQETFADAFALAVLSITLPRDEWRNLVPETKAWRKTEGFVRDYSRIGFVPDDTLLAAGRLLDHDFKGALMLLVNAAYSASKRFS